MRVTGPWAELPWRPGWMARRERPSFRETGDLGRAQFEFDMPRLAGAEPALVIERCNGSAKGHLRFQLRTSRVPSRVSKCRQRFQLW